MPEIALRFVRGAIIAGYLEFLFGNKQRLVTKVFRVLTDLVKLGSKGFHGLCNFAQILIVLTLIFEAFQPHQSVTSSALVFIFVHGLTSCFSQLLCFALRTLQILLSEVEVFEEVINDDVVGAFLSSAYKRGVEELKEFG